LRGRRHDRPHLMRMSLGSQSHATRGSGHLSLALVDATLDLPRVSNGVPGDPPDEEADRPPSPATGSRRRDLATSRPAEHLDDRTAGFDDAVRHCACRTKLPPDGGEVTTVGVGDMPNDRVELTPATSWALAEQFPRRSLPRGSSARQPARITLSNRAHSATFALARSGEGITPRAPKSVVALPTRRSTTRNSSSRVGASKPSRVERTTAA